MDYLTKVNITAEIEITVNASSLEEAEQKALDVARQIDVVHTLNAEVISCKESQEINTYSICAVCTKEKIVEVTDESSIADTIEQLKVAEELRIKDEHPNTSQVYKCAPMKKSNTEYSVLIYYLFADNDIVANSENDAKETFRKTYQNLGYHTVEYVYIGKEDS